MSWTTRFRIVFTLLFCGVVATALVGWLLGRDPSQLGSVLMSAAGAVGVGEMSNVGKRATFKREAVDMTA